MPGGMGIAPHGRGSRTGVRLIAAMEKVSQITVMRVVYNIYCFLTILSRFKALPFLVILEDLHSTIPKKCATNAQFISDILFTDETGYK
jgi:hypothetical protein